MLEAHHLRRDCQAQPKLLAGLLYLGFRGGRGSVRGSRGLRVGHLWQSRQHISRVSYLFHALPRSVISANVKLALRCKSMFWLYTSVLNAAKGSPVKKSVSAL